MLNNLTRKTISWNIVGFEQLFRLSLYVNNSHYHTKTYAIVMTHEMIAWQLCGFSFYWESWWFSTHNLTVKHLCTQTRIHRTQSLHYDKLLKRSSLRHIVTTNFAATIYRGDISFCFARYRCNEVSLERYLSEILRRLYQYLDDLSF